MFLITPLVGWFRDDERGEWWPVGCDTRTGLLHRVTELSNFLGILGPDQDVAAITATLEISDIPPELSQAWRQPQTSGGSLYKHNGQSYRCPNWFVKFIDD